MNQNVKINVNNLTLSKLICTFQNEGSLLFALDIVTHTIFYTLNCTAFKSIYYSVIAWHTIYLGKTNTDSLTIH